MATNKAHDPEEELRRLIAQWPDAAFTRPLFRVRDWMAHFENSGTRKLDRLRFVLVPNKHDGKGYARLAARPEPEQLFCSFVLLLEIASKSPARGYLCDEEGPFTADDCAVMTRMPARGFERAFDELPGAAIGWLDKFEARDRSEILPLFDSKPGDSPTSDPPSGRKREKPGEFLPDWKGREWNGIPPIAPQGGQSAGDSARCPRLPASPSGQPAAGDVAPLHSGNVLSEPASVSEKKENGGAAAKRSAGAGTFAVIEETERKICELFGRKQLGGGYRGFVAAVSESLPLQSEVWTWLRAMIAARKAAGASAEDYRLRFGWLVTADKLAENLLSAVDVARDWWGEIGGASAGPKKEKGAPAPSGWKARLQQLYPQADVPADFDELPPEVQAELRKEAA
jgi:hypothetical protein